MKRKNAFSLMENMLILIVLSVLIIISLPKLVNIKSKATKQILLRKVITTYQVILTKEMLSSSGIRTTDDFNDYLKSNSYENIVDRLNIKNKNCSEDSCTFTTENGVYWDVTTPSRAMVSLKNAQGVSFDNAKNSGNTNVFLIPFEVINGNLKVLLTKDDNYRDAVHKTQNFINSD